MPPLTWDIGFVSVGFHHRGFENCCAIAGATWRARRVWPCASSGSTSPSTSTGGGGSQFADDAGRWRATGFMGGVDISVSCIVDPEGRDRAHLKEHQEDELRYARGLGHYN